MTREHVDPAAAHAQGRQRADLEVAGQSAPQAVFELLGLGRREKADRAEVDAEDRDVGAGERAQRAQDRAVAAEHDRDVDLELAEVGHRRDGAGPGDAWSAPVSIVVEDQLAVDARPRPRAGGRAPARRCSLREVMCDDRGAHAWMILATAARRPPHAACSRLPRRSRLVSASQRNASRLPAGPGRPDEQAPSTAKPIASAGLRGACDRVDARRRDRAPPHPCRSLRGRPRTAASRAQACRTAARRSPAAPAAPFRAR